MYSFLIINSFKNLLIMCYLEYKNTNRLLVFFDYLAFCGIICANEGDIISSIIFYSFSLICMSISFYIMDGENVSQGLYGMFVSNSIYHGGAYTGVLRAIFTLIMPSLLIGAIPVEIVKSASLKGIVIIALLAIVWFILSVMFFYKSLKKYESNNLYGFGG